ncbi:MAG: ADP-glyceromanno-heptose 6-epimerase [Bacteroidales bacterium]|nr:ADP-glyceromanno-heptose 6-epimerase [Bacteroidales bacterium]
MIVVTGAAGFIGSCLLAGLNEAGHNEIAVVDDFSREDKNKNLERRSFVRKVHRDRFFDWLAANHDEVEFIFHLGARTDTAEFRKEIFDALNLDYSKDMWNACASYHIPLIYASSAATYGLGELGYDDNHELVNQLKPLNPYGESKNEFDQWMLGQEKQPDFWAGLKFFNVYGPNEYHKGRMASVIFHAYNQIKDTGKVKLFRSHHPDFEDGKQLRDFIYVKDVVDVMLYLMEKKPQPAIYNLGTGKARTFLDLAKATFSALNKKENIEFIETPKDIRDKYQYFTEAKMDKLRKAGYNKPFTTLEDGVTDYVRNYLGKGEYW